MPVLEAHLETYQSCYTGVKVIVLGAAGFIGRWVARYLSMAGAELSLVVRDRDAAIPIFADYGVVGNIYELDLCDHERIRALYDAVRPSITFNLAGYGIDRTERDEELAYQLNVDLVTVVCDAIGKVRDRSWPGQEIVHVGTAMEYGETSGNLAEDSDARPTTLYGQSKLAGTLMLAERCQTHGLKGLTARLFAIYGPGELPVRLLPSLMETARLKQPIQMTAGLHERDFVYVEDVAEGLLRLGLAQARAGEVVNVATGHLTSIREFVEEAASVLGIPDKLLQFGVLPTRTEEMRHAPVANARLKELTDWTPNITIIQGVERAIRFSERSL